uniref:Uncharacterized protein n=1 Tax=Picea sitchensis TaxID=3332 RepID=D5AEI8_PICSI|nr:unknown [Picea sitchensis]
MIFTAFARQRHCLNQIMFMYFQNSTMSPNICSLYYCNICIGWKGARGSNIGGSRVLC